MANTGTSEDPILIYDEAIKLIKKLQIEQQKIEELVQKLQELEQRLQNAGL